MDLCVKIIAILFLVTSDICEIVGIPNIDLENKRLVSDIDLSYTDHFISKKCIPIAENLEVYKFQIHGSIIYFGDIPDKNPCKGKIRFFELFALDKIIIDKDLIKVGEVVQVVAIAPKIEVIGERNVNLNGAPGKNRTPGRALDGQFGIPGVPGMAGLPGGPGGIFFGLANEIQNSNFLNISADGGIGGQGKDGGNGGNGISGRPPSASNLPSLEIFFSPVRNWVSCGGNIILCKLLGQKGYRGGNGGNGGRGGKGGKAGQIFLHQLDEKATKIKKQYSFDGRPGLEGKGGKGGQGGKHGGFMILPCCKSDKTLFGKADEPVRSLDEFAPSGKNGSSGASSKNLEDPEEFQGFQNFSSVVNDYKKFLRSHLSDESRKERLIEFYNQLITSKEINLMYGTHALLDDLKDLEEEYLNLTTTIDLASWYKSLENRIEDYAGHRWESELSDEYVIALGFAYTATMSKANRLAGIKDNSLVINLRKYLETVEESLDILQEKKLQLTMNRHDRDNKHQIQIKLEEASKFIKTQLKVKVDKIHDELQERVYHFINETMVLKEEALKRRDALQKIMYQNFLMKMLKLIVAATSALVSGGSVAATAAFTAVPIGDLFSRFHVNQPSKFKLQNWTENDYKEVLEMNEFYKNNKFIDQINHLGYDIEKVNDDMKNLKLYQDAIFLVLIPLLQRMKKDLSIDKELSLQNATALDVSKWRVQSSLINVRTLLKKITLGFEVPDDINILTESLDDTISTLINIYDRIETYLQEKKLATYIDYVNNGKFFSFSNKNEKLQKAVVEAKIIIQRNVALFQYARALKVFKQFVFPYAECYLDTFNKPVVLELNALGDFETLLNKISDNIKTMRKDLKHENAYTSGYNIISGKLGPDNEYVGPVYTWKNSNYSKMISDLLEGKEVILVPDAREFGHNAVKFKDIRISFKTSDTTTQQSLNKKLESFHIKMSHEGNSYYKCSRKMFVISHETFNFTKSFSPEWEETNPLKQFLHGDFMVSPFAVWKVKIGSSKGTVPLNYFQEFKNKVDLVLEAVVFYIPSDASYICDSNLEAYYEPYFPITNSIK